jgi:outer membrane protein assembly complex protein YaeT
LTVVRRVVGVAAASVLLLPAAAGATPLQNAEAAGQSPHVEDLIIEGVESVDESELRATLATRESPWLPWRPKQYFDEDTFEADLERIEKFYAAKGYPHARVAATDVKRADGGVVATIRISEGPAERVFVVRFTGFDEIGPSRRRALTELAPLKPGVPLAEDLATQTAQLAQFALGDAGYPYAQVEIRKTPAGPNEVTIDVHADPGPIGVFGPITIAGNSTIDDGIIRRQLAYRPGERFRAVAMRESHRRLSTLGLFESVSIEIAGERAPAAVPTLITVKEADLNQVSYLFGYGTEEQVNGEIQWRHLNFLGGGRTLSLRGRWSSIDRGGEGTFVQPFFFTPRMSLQVRGHGWQLDEPLYTATFQGGSSRVTYALAPYDRVSVDYLQEFERVRLNADAASAADREALGLNARDGRQSGMLAQTAVDYSRDTTIEPVSPRRGYRAFARLERAGGWLPGSFSYYNLFAVGRYYRSVGPLTFAGRIQAGSMTPQGRDGVPFAKRYFLGGADTLRGWGRLEVSPLAATGAPIGGHSMLAMNAEMRLPVLRPLSAVVFADAGNVWRDSWTIRLDDLRADAGAGLRIDSPFGLLRFDWAYQLNPIPGLRVDGDLLRRRWRVHFGAGHTF